MQQPQLITIISTPKLERKESKASIIREMVDNGQSLDQIEIETDFKRNYISGVIKAYPFLLARLAFRKKKKDLLSLPTGTIVNLIGDSVQFLRYSGVCAYFLLDAGKGKIDNWGKDDFIEELMR